MIFIGGYHASGKTEVAKMLAKLFHVLHIESSAFVKAAHKSDGSDMSLRDWAICMERQYGATVFDDLIADSAASILFKEADAGRYYDDVIISGNRSMVGVERIEEKLIRYGVPVPHTREIIAIHTPVEILYQRFRARCRDPQDAEITMEDYMTVLEYERASGLEQILRNATYSIDNSGDLYRLTEEVKIYGEHREFKPCINERKDYINA